MSRVGKSRLAALLAVAVLLSACGAGLPGTHPPGIGPSATPAAAIVATAASTATKTAVATATQAGTLTSPPPPSVWLAPYLPESFRRSIQLAPGVVEVGGPEGAAFTLQVGEGEPLSRWVYALAAPFPTVPDGVSFEELQQAWQGAGSSRLLMDASTLGVFTALWGEPGAGAIEVVSAQDLLGNAWANPPALAILPFEQLEPRWKVLEVGGVTPLDKDFDPAAYPLTAHFSLVAGVADPGSADPGSAVLSSWQATNHDPAKMTDVMLTGVTALVRATAETMRRKGNTYPAQDIGALLRSADFAHVSNEIPFSPKCPLPDAWQTELVFCSQPSYIELLEEIGTDVVELTGDHFGDWGADAMNYTLDLYNGKGMRYYGGGYNFEEARQPLLVEHNGNRLAFIGCNAKGKSYATAREDNPGAILCDFEWLGGEIARLRSEGYLPIVTFQHREYYSYVPQPPLIEDFHKVADAGAVIVSGSQAHQPHGLEFYQDALIHYGLGNLFFDQYHMGLPTGQGFIDRHIFYDGRHISTQLIGIRFVDFARPRLMTPEEREELLNSVFDASLW